MHAHTDSSSTNTELHAVQTTLAARRYLSYDTYLCQNEMCRCLEWDYVSSSALGAAILPVARRYLGRVAVAPTLMLPKARKRHVHGARLCGLSARAA